MPRFKLIPLRNPGEILEFVASNAAESLIHSSRRMVGEAHLYQDDDYLFTIRQGTDGGGCWVIETRPGMAGSRFGMHESGRASAVPETASHV